MDNLIIRDLSLSEMKEIEGGSILLILLFAFVAGFLAGNSQ